MPNMLTSGEPAGEDVREHIKGWNKAIKLKREGGNESAPRMCVAKCAIVVCGRHAL